MKKMVVLAGMLTLVLGGVFAQETPQETPLVAASIGDPETRSESYGLVGVGVKGQKGSSTPDDTGISIAVPFIAGYRWDAWGLGGEVFISKDIREGYFTTAGSGSGFNLGLYGERRLWAGKTLSLWAKANLAYQGLFAVKNSSQLYNVHSLQIKLAPVVEYNITEYFRAFVAVDLITASFTGVIAKKYQDETPYEDEEDLKGYKASAEIMNNVLHNVTVGVKVTF
ncbi:MAG: hypothetical protein LBG84_01840 [Treponema sp.]|nr:hypothetical protein [Treponema sp.]